MPKILMVVSGADHVTLADGTTHPTGYWAEEVAASHEVLRAAGADVDLATPGGVAPTVDPISLSGDEAARFRTYLDGIAGQLDAPLALADVKAADYDAIYLPGGHAPMTDLADDEDLGRLLTAATADGRIVAALCHGVAGLLSATGPDGFVFAGRTLTSFTDEEERLGGLGENTPYFVESVLRDRGAVVTTGPAWTSQVVEDGNLITGQNPQSSVDTAKRVVAALAR